MSTKRHAGAQPQAKCCIESSHALLLRAGISFLEVHTHILTRFGSVPLELDSEKQGQILASLPGEG
jgi:hypothetical protein